MNMQRASARYLMRGSFLCLGHCPLSTMTSPSSDNMDIISSLCTHDQLEEAVHYAEHLDLQVTLISKNDFYALLQACNKQKNLDAGWRVLTLMVKCRLEASAFLGYHLIWLFGSCGHFKEAYRIFNMILRPNEHTFHAMILACAWAGESKKLFELYYKLQEAGLKPDKFVFSSILNCCDSLGSVEMGKLVHDQIIRCGLQSNLILGNTLIDMYCKCRYLDEAYNVFCSMSSVRDAVSWGSLIGGYTQHGDFSSALMAYHKMQTEGFNPSKVTFLCILKACATWTDIEHGKWVHFEIIKSGTEQELRVGSALVGMYTNCKSLEEARQVFDTFSNRDVVAWGTIMTGYSQQGHPTCVLELFESLKLEETKPDLTCFLNGLSACSKLGAARQGKLMHWEILERELGKISLLVGALVDMYAHCGSLDDAQKVFKDSPDRDDVSYGAMISGYVQNGQDVSALHAYAEMQKHVVVPSKFVFSCSLKACSSLGTLREGAHIHDQVLRAGLETDTVVGSAIVDMYCKCSSVAEASKAFEALRERDLVSWGAMIVGYAQCGLGYLAYDLFKKMQQEGTIPDTYVFTGTLKACGIVAALKEGMFIHSQIIEVGCEIDTAIGSALIDMYVKCRSLDEALGLFEKLSRKNIEAWGAIIAGCTLFGHGLNALECFNQMLQESVKPDLFIFALIVKACASEGAEAEGKLVHYLTVRNGLESDEDIGNAFVDMYCKCGRLEDARWEFDQLEYPDPVCWGAMVSGYCLYEQWVCALELFGCMQEKGIKSSKTTLFSLLKACGHVGALEQGKLVHDQIIRNSYDLDTLLGTTLVETYAKCGVSAEAQKVFGSLSGQDLVAWGSLLAGYAQHGDCGLIAQSFKQLQKQGLKPNDFIFTNLLTACSHAGSVVGAAAFFRCMAEEYGILPDIEQYSCVIDLFGRLGSLKEAEDMLQTMAITPDFIHCTSLLNNSERHGNVALARWSFDQLVKLIPSDAAGYITISNLYADETVDSSMCLSAEVCGME